MKFILFMGFLMIATSSQAQHDIQTTTNVTIEGKVKNSISFSLVDFNNYKTISIDSVVIYNHLMERKKVIKSIKGILLKEVLGKVEFDISNPRFLSEFYITCMAADGYKVVFSWNEIFNSTIDSQAMIITEADGEKAKDRKDCIALLCPADLATGRRYVQGLQKIIIERVQ
jgi:hypothetical protein